MSEQISLIPTTDRTAVLSHDGVYRYRLGRRWAHTAADPMLFVMCNPSIADAYVDDPTIRRCIGFAKREGCTAIDVVNLYAFRATKPVRVAEAAARGVDVVGPNNAAHLADAIQYAGCVVFAWGSSLEQVPGWEDRVHEVVDKTYMHHDPMALGHTAQGHPRHPLYVKADAPLVDAGLA